MTASTLELGVRLFRELGQEFSASVFGTTRRGLSSLPCGAVAGDDDSSVTAFYLNPFVDGECAGVDFVVIVMLAVVVHAVSWWPRWMLWEPLANSRMHGHKGWDASECQRFSQTATSLLFFCMSAFFASRILLPKEWLFSREAWVPLRAFVDADFKFYYLLYIARFLSDLVSIFFEDRKQEAFIASFIHHLVTIGLVYGSAACGHIGYGGIIMFFFDWADIPLLAAKLFKYLSKHPRDLFQFCANRLFEAFALCFLLTRNVYYNYVVYAALADLEANFVNRSCQALMIMLVGLQTYWLYLIFKAVERQQRRGGNIEDVREKDA